MNIWPFRKPPPSAPRAADVRLPEPARDLPRPVATAQPDAPASPRHSPPGSGWLPKDDLDHAALLDDGIEGGRRLDYPEAARAFVDWLQANEETGEISRPRLEMLYARHCADESLAMVPGNYLFQAMARLAPRWERRVTRRDGRRQRVTTYDIPRQPVTPLGSAPRLPGHSAGAQSRAHDRAGDEMATATRRAA